MFVAAFSGEHVVRLHCSKLRAGTLGLLAIVIAGCAQSRKEVAVGIGTEAYEVSSAQPYAALYLPYAQMASLAYVDPEPGGNHPYCPNAGLIKRTDAIKGGASGGAPLQEWLADLKNDWECMFGDVGPIACPQHVRCIEGLQYQVWRKIEKTCSEVVIVFRGTDRNDPGDWISNAHWVVGRFVFDEYDQAQAAIGGIIDKIHRAGCSSAHIIATGHSLGGGLAQAVAYADSRINYVYAFDSSPVTAYFGAPALARPRANSTLGIDRIYEAEEILSLPRYLASGIFPSPSCHPRVRIVRFAIPSDVSALDRHRMTALALGLEKLARHQSPRNLPRAYEAARNCSYVPRGTI
jgi:hypothetical protein